MSSRLRLPRLGFGGKVLSPVLICLVLFLAYTLWLLNEHLTRFADEHSHRELQTAEAVFRNSLGLRSRNLLARYSNQSAEPRFKAVVSTRDPETIRNRLEEMMSETRNEADLLLFTDEHASPLAAVRKPGLSELGEARFTTEQFTSAAHESIQDALHGQSEADIIAVQDRIFHVVSIPVEINRSLAGALLVGVAVNEAVLKEIKSLTTADIVLISDHSISASSLDRGVPGTQMLELARRLIHDGRGRKSDGRMEPVVIGGEHFLGFGGSLKPAGGPIGFLLLASREHALVELNKLRQSLLWFSVLGTAAISISIGFLVRKTTEPLRVLQQSAEAVGRGDFTRRTEVVAEDECGDLARAFNQMMENVQKSHLDLELAIERLRTTQSQLIQSEKLSAIGQFVAGVAHELNNPLTTVIGFSQLLRQSSASPSQREHLEYIVGSADRCHRIVHNLLAFARQRPPERKPVNLKQLVDEVAGFLSYDLRTSNITLNLEHQAGLALIVGDAHQLQQVFVNIISNARQAIESVRHAGSIRVTTRTREGWVSVEFLDDGPGIAPEHQKRIFDPFFTTKPVGKGTGLGLSLSYGIVREHGGSISVTSEVGHGAAFLLEFPVAAASPPALHETLPIVPPSQMRGRGRSVLVVDDEEGVRRLVKGMLEQDGYVVELARDGAEALVLAGRSYHDVILSDWKMPGTSGVRFHEQLLLHHPAAATRVLFMTGDVINPAIERFLAESGRPHLTKPFTLHQLLDAVALVASSITPGSGK